jgi:hypothetical protein
MNGFSFLGQDVHIERVAVRPRQMTNRLTLPPGLLPGGKALKQASAQLPVLDRKNRQDSRIRELLTMPDYFSGASLPSPLIYL